VLLQLLETADQSTKDVGGLNAKLNRKRYKEAKNSIVQESFIRRSMDNVGSMDHNLSVFGDHSRTNKDEMSANLGEVSTLICENLVEGIPFNQCS